jgi:hypothetical protein
MDWVLAADSAFCESRIMGSRKLIVAGLVVGALAPGVAFACEPIGEPKPWSTSGLAQFVATATASRGGAAEIRATLVVGRNGAETIPPGPIVLVPWSFGPDCKPVAWHPGRDGAWAPPETAAFYAGRLRSRDAWVDGVRTVDIEMARLQPIWHGGETDRGRYGTTSGSLLTPYEFFDFYRVLPTSEEFDARRPAALARVTAWEAAHQEMAAREPVSSMLRWLRMVWTR